MSSKEEERNKLKKLKKENRKLHKELSGLRKDFMKIEKKVKNLRRDERKKRKREEEDDSKEKKRDKKLSKKNEDAGLKSLQSTPPKDKKKSAAGKTEVKVRNPFTLSNNKITVRDASKANNQHLWKIVNDYRNGKYPYGFDKEMTKAGLIQLFSDALFEGLTSFEKGAIPDEILESAVDLFKRKTGAEVVLLSESSSISESESASEAPQPITSFRGNMDHYQIKFKGKDMNKGFMECLAGASDEVTSILRAAQKKYKSFRWYADYTVLMGRGVHVDPDTGETTNVEQREVKLSSSDGEGGMISITKKSDVESAPSRIFQVLTDNASDYSDLGSGFVYLASISLDIYISKQVYGTQILHKTHMNKKFQAEEPFRGGDDGPEKAGRWMPLPLWLCNKYAVSNPKPSNFKVDERCFEWCVLRALHPSPTKQPGNVADLQQYVDKEVKLPPGVTYPIPLEDGILRKIEEINDFSLTLFAIGKEEDVIRPIYISEAKAKGKKHIRLGVLSDGIAEWSHHFVLINRLEAIINKDKSNTYFHSCERCLTVYKTLEQLDSHLEICGKHEPCMLHMPAIGSKDQFIRFNSWSHLLPSPFVIYADFECILVPNKEGGHDHIPSCFSYHIKCQYHFHTIVKGYKDKPLGDVRVYTGPDCMDEFFKSIFFDTDLMMHIIKTTDMPFKRMPGDKEKFDGATVCHICRKPFTNSEDGRRHLDHDHITGLFRGAAHDSCNQHFSSKKMKHIPCVFHNLKGYDGYNILSYLHRTIKDVNKIDVIAKNLEKFTCITVNQVRFIDSLQFLNGSLDGLVNALRNSVSEELVKQKFRPVGWLLGKSHSGDDEDTFRELLKKGIYPYEWLDSFDKMFEARKRLPAKFEFYSTLTGKSITDEEYERAEKMWKRYRCKSMKDYTELYCMLDVLLLESVFEAFRKTSIEEDTRLDPVHYVTAPSMSWSAMLLMNHDNDVVLENMTDLDMFLMVENGIRGGICQVMHPFSRARIKESKEEDMQANFLFDQDIGSQILYLDANNLYGWAMTQLLPEGDYRWEFKDSQTSGSNDTKGKEKKSIWECEDMERVAEYIQELPDDGERGYILEVDISYPKEYHDYWNDYPFCPEAKIPIPSPYTQAEMRKLGIFQARTKAKKLVCDLEPKKKYVIFYRSLKQALKHHVQLDKVHRVISFKQSDWLARYIMHNTEKRKLAKDSIGQDLYKLKNNSVFGKTMEDFRKRRNIKFFTEKDMAGALADASSPWCKHWRVITKDKLLIMEMAKRKITFTRPVIIGQVILDLSKLHMFNFHYEVMRPAFIENGFPMRMMYTDTDSLVYELCDSPERLVDEALVQLQKEKDIFDLSEMRNQDNALMKAGFDVKKNAKVLGKFKDECSGYRVAEFVALRSKMYSFRMYDEHFPDKKKAKGIPAKALLKETGQSLTHDDYMISFMGEPELRTVTFNAICHDKTFKLQTRQISKVGLSACDDKSYYFEAAASLRHGHHMIARREEEHEKNFKDWFEMRNDISHHTDDSEEEEDDYDEEGSKIAFDSALADDREFKEYESWEYLKSFLLD